MIRSALFLGCLLLQTVSEYASAGERLPIWPAAVAAEMKGAATLEFLPVPEDNEVKANGSIIIVLPGGGYRQLMDTYEGADASRYFHRHGIHGAVLRYRVGQAHPAPLEDALRAIQYVRAHAAEHGVDPKKIGVMGFSAGGHLASTALTLHQPGDPQSSDPVSMLSSRPDFGILCYPVISMLDADTHKGSRKTLLGEKADDPEMQKRLSTHLRVNATTPPTFLVHTGGDTVVLPRNSILFYESCLAAKVPAELLIIGHGPHGIGLGKDAHQQRWPEQAASWMTNHGFLPKP